MTLGGSSSSSNSSKRSVSERAFSGVGNLVRLLPTGTVFLFQFLSPVLTNNGRCNITNKILTAVLLLVCGFTCAFATFTDSYIGIDGSIHYGVATFRGIWPSTASGGLINLRVYKLRLGDFVHAIFSVAVFAALSVLSPNTFECYFPLYKWSEKIWLGVLPPVVGLIAGSVFMVYPNTRHGIGYPDSSASSSSSS